MKGCKAMAERKTIKELKQMTVKQLRKEVWALTKDVNERVSTITDSKTIEMYDRIKVLSGGTEEDKKIFARVNYKTKSQLIVQVREMQRFQAMDNESEVYSNEEFEQLKQFNKDMEKVIPNYQPINSEQFRQISDAFKANQDILEDFGYKEIVDLVSHSGKTIDLVGAMRKVKNDPKNKGIESDALLTALYKEVKLKND